jgi:hypothetical protein
MDVNLIGASYTARLAFYHLKKNPGTGLKSIVLLGSMCESSFVKVEASAEVQLPAPSS